MPKENKFIDYDEEPVEYCTKCYSLKIKYEETIDCDCCMECGSTETAITDIGSWERMYEKRYGQKYIEKNKDPRNTLFFKMSLAKLKDTLYHSSLFYFILRKLYPRFPRGLSKADSTILLFDKLIKDNRLDDLRYLLYNYSYKHNSNGREEDKRSKIKQQ